MRALSDPLILGGSILGLFLLAKGAYSLWGEVMGRRRRRLKDQRDARIVMADYRARYGAENAPKRLEADLETTRGRVGGLAARWKDCQRRAQEALGHREERSLGEEERRAHQAFVAEATRLRLLRQAEEFLRD